MKKIDEFYQHNIKLYCLGASHLDDLFIIVVQVGSLGKAIGNKRIQFIPGVVSNHELTLDFINY